MSSPEKKTGEESIQVIRGCPPPLLVEQGSGSKFRGWVKLSHSLMDRSVLNSVQQGFSGHLDADDRHV